jgi:hypothetical protein
MKAQATWDIEIFKNYLLIALKNPTSNKVLSFEVKGADNSLTIYLHQEKYLVLTQTLSIYQFFF